MTSSRVEVTRPDKLLWPAIGITKQAYVDYLGAVADRMLPWLRDRPLSLVRAPDGVDGQRYFQKNTPSHAPSWIKTVSIPAPSANRDVAYTVCNDADVRRNRLDRPDLLVVDIDPPDDAFDAAVEVALLVLDVLDDLRLESLLKTTGGKGLHVVVPIVRSVAPERLRHAATRLTEIVTERRPELVTAEFRKAKREGRVMLDPSRNGTGATLVAPYSPRIRTDGTVSFPVLPKDLRRIAPGDFTLATVPRRLGGAAVRLWTEAASGAHQRLPASLLAE